MLTKSYSKTGKSCRVTFRAPAELEADTAAVLGEWNTWSPENHPMKKRKDGSWSVTVSLDAGQDYRFRYLLDGERWTNDETPDRLVANRFGSEDCVVAL